MPCFKNTETVLSEIENRLKVPNMQDRFKKNEMAELAERLVQNSY